MAESDVVEYIEVLNLRLTKIEKQLKDIESKVKLHLLH